jgi:hypothetical protein
LEFIAGLQKKNELMHNLNVFSIIILSVSRREIKGKDKKRMTKTTEQKKKA